MNGLPPGSTVALRWRAGLLRLLGGPAGWMLLPVIGVLMAAAAVHVMTPRFQASTSIMSPRTPPANPLQVYADIVSPPAAARRSDHLYANLLRSESVLDALVLRFDLQRSYGQTLRTQTRRELMLNTRVQIDRAGLLRVVVEDVSPTRAAALANAYVEELRSVLGRMAAAEVTSRIAYLDEQLDRVDARLQQREQQLQALAARGAGVWPDEQRQVQWRALAELQAQTALRRVELAGRLAALGPDHPERRRLSAELASLKDASSQMDPAALVDTGMGIDAATVPSRAAAAHAAGRMGDRLQQERLWRDVEFDRQLMRQLRLSREAALIDRIREPVLVQQVDVAQVPELVGSPKPLQWWLAGALLGLALRAAWPLFKVLNGLRRAPLPVGLA